MKAQRVKLGRLGKPYRSIVIEQAPFAEAGETITEKSTGLEWIVLSVEDTEIIAHLPLAQPQ